MGETTRFMNHVGEPDCISIKKDICGCATKWIIIREKDVPINTFMGYDYGMGDKCNNICCQNKMRASTKEGKKRRQLLSRLPDRRRLYLTLSSSMVIK